MIAQTRGKEPQVGSEDQPLQYLLQKRWQQTLGQGGADLERVVHLHGKQSAPRQILVPRSHQCHNPVMKPNITTGKCCKLSI